MSLPVPRPGLVVRYRFLWSNEKAEGAAEGSKDRPCAIIVAIGRDLNGDIDTIVAPITHRPPDDPEASIEIPATTCRSLGFDDCRHWLRLDELNRFAWPGYDLRPIPGHRDRYDYGLLPHGLFQQVREGILNRQKVRAGKIISRDDDVS